MTFKGVFGLMGRQSSGPERLYRRPNLKRQTPSSRCFSCLLFQRFSGWRQQRSAGAERTGTDSLTWSQRSFTWWHGSSWRSSYLRSLRPRAHSTAAWSRISRSRSPIGPKSHRSSIRTKTAGGTSTWGKITWRYERARVSTRAATNDYF